jgi:3-deoxy-D-glycero-D-galacto-nononate 9-phosphatase
MVPKLIITDIDGVWTDGGMYYDNGKNEFKKFNTTDSAGVLFLQLLKIPLVVISGENTPIISRRCKKLKIESFFLGVKDKLKLARDYCKKNKFSLKEVAYIGDDINDIPLLKAAGFSAVPAGVPQYISKYAKLKLKKKGGEGAFREFIEHILVRNDLMDKALALYFETKEFKQ